jgi:predicted DCC family thiol-disulfide oxidoreductase YuxK
MMPQLSSTKSYSPMQFTLVRSALGLYLVWHYGGLLPNAGELLGAAGLVADPALNPWHGLLPNPLAAAALAGVVWFPVAWCALGLLLALALTVGWWRRYAAVLLWFVWATCADRNALAANAALPYVGLLLLFVAAVPDGEPLRLGGRARAPADWFMPSTIYAGMWWILAAGYAFSGAIKLGRPEWLNGEALRLLLEQPLARPGIFRDWLLAQPQWVDRMLTWTILAAECAFLPLCLTRAGRWVAWIGMVLLQVGLLFVLDVAGVALGLLLAHAFVLDGPGWLPPRANVVRQPTLLFDDECGLCRAAVRFLLREDLAQALRFASLQSTAGQAILRRLNLPLDEFDSVVFLPDGDGTKYYLRTSALCAVLRTLGGLWNLMGWLWLIPRPLRDLAYRFVASVRKWVTGPWESQPLTEKEREHQFLG